MRILYLIRNPEDPRPIQAAADHARRSVEPKASNIVEPKASYIEVTIVLTPEAKRAPYPYLPHKLLDPGGQAPSSPGSECVNYRELLEMIWEADRVIVW